MAGIERDWHGGERVSVRASKAATEEANGLHEFVSSPTIGSWQVGAGVGRRPENAGFNLDLVPRQCLFTWSQGLRAGLFDAGQGAEARQLVGERLVV
jgi:hypothetical protein